MIEAPLNLGAELLRGGVPMDGLHRSLPVLVSSLLHGDSIPSSSPALLSTSQTGAAFHSHGQTHWSIDLDTLQKRRLRQWAERGPGVQRSAVPFLDLLDVIAESGSRKPRECQLYDAPGWAERIQDMRASSAYHYNSIEAKDRVSLVFFSSLHIELLAIKQQL